MPLAIDTVYVHQPVDEADFPLRRIPPESVADAAALSIQPQPIRSASSGPWSARSPVQAVPPIDRVGRDLTPLATFLFFVWIAMCLAYEVMG